GDCVATVDLHSQADRRASEALMTGAVGVYDVARRRVRVLAQLTNQVAIVQYPTLTRSSVRHVEVVSLGGGRLMLIVITSTGRVEQRIVEVADPPSEELIEDMRDRIGTACAGYRLPEAAVRASQIISALPAGEQPGVSSL